MVNCSNLLAFSSVQGVENWNGALLSKGRESDEPPMEKMAVIMNEEQRTFTRVPFEHPVGWLEAQGQSGAGVVLNVGRGGVCLLLGRYLRPGRSVEVRFNDIEFRGEPVTLRARVAWCRPADRGSVEFAAGLRVVHDEATSLAAISEVFYAAVDRFRASASSEPMQNLS